MGTGFSDIVYKVLTRRAARLATIPLGQLRPVIDDLEIPTTIDNQPDHQAGIRINFAVHVRHELVGLHRLTLPDWLRTHRASDQRTVAFLVAGDFTLPLAWSLANDAGR